MTLGEWPLLITVALFFLLLVPYELYSSVQLSYFLHPFHQVDPHFLSRDWFVTQTVPPHPFFGSLVAFFQAHGILPQAFFMLYVGQWLLLLWGIFRLSRLFSEDFRLPILVSWLLLFYFSDGLGQSTLFSSIVQPTDLAVPFYLLSVVYLFEEKIIRAWIFLGLSGLFHIHLGLDGLLVLLLFYLLSGRPWQLKQMALGFLLFLIFFSPNLLPLMKNFRLLDSSGDSEVLKVFFNFRSPHHYRASTFEWAHVFRVIFPVFFMGLIKNKDGRPKPFFAARLFVLIVTGLCVVATISTELFYWPSVAKLFLFRLSPFLLLAGLVFLSMALLEEVDSKNLGGILWAGLAFTLFYLEKDSRLFIPLGIYLIGIRVCAAIAGTRYALPLQPNLKKFTGFTLFLPLIVAFLATHRSLDLVLNGSLASFAALLLKVNPKRLVVGARHAVPLLWVFLFIGIPASVFHFIQPQRLSFHPLRITPPSSVSKESPAFYQTLLWIRDHTPQEAVLLSPPYLDGARFFAQRAIVADFQVHPFTIRELAEWKTRLERITGGWALEKWNPVAQNTNPQQEFLRKGYLHLEPEAIEEISNQYDVDYFVTESNFSAKEDLIRREHPLIFSNDSFLVFQMKRASS